MKTNWESELATFLTELSAVQGDSLDVLGRKRDALAHSDTEKLATIQADEEVLMERLRQCLARREELLARAADQGLPADSIRSLAGELAGPQSRQMVNQLNQTTQRARLLQHHSLTNWVLAQRTLIHLSQILEIIATGGRQKPTYSKEEKSQNRGALVDRVA